MRKVGAQGEFVTNSWANRCSGTRMANVHTTDRRLRFSMVVRLSEASWRELNVIPAVKRPKRPLLWGVRKKKEHLNKGMATYNPMQTHQCALTLPVFVEVRGDGQDGIYRRGTHIALNLSCKIYRNYKCKITECSCIKDELNEELEGCFRHHTSNPARQVSV
jgi:hypothetical protein